MSDLLQEVDEALKRERAEKLWREYGPILIGGAVLLVILTGAFAAWNGWKHQNNARQTTMLISALETPYPAMALQTANEHLSGTHKVFGQMQLAGQLMQDDKQDEALALYKEIAAQRFTPAIWRDLAVLMAARLEWNDGVEEEKARQIYASLKPLLAKKNPWRLQAALQSALIAGDSFGDYKTAVQLLADPVNDPKAPASLKNRAKALDHFYTMKLSATLPTGQQAAQNEQKG